MYIYKSLYALQQGDGLLSQNDNYIVYDNVLAALERSKELTEGMGIEVKPIDLYDYYKEYRGFKEGFKVFYERVSKKIHAGDSVIKLIK